MKLEMGSLGMGSLRLGSLKPGLTYLLTHTDLTSIWSRCTLPITETKNGDHFYRPKYPPKCGKTHLRNHFWPLESGFLAIAKYKTRISSKPSNLPIFPLLGGESIHHDWPKTIESTVGLFWPAWASFQTHVGSWIFIDCIDILIRAFHSALVKLIFPALTRSTLSAEFSGGADGDDGQRQASDGVG